MNSNSAALLKASSLVLDTNVVLDWLVFRHPACQTLQACLTNGSVRWLASPAMRDELAQVLARGVLDSWQPEPSALWAAWDRHAIQTDVVALAGAASRVRCTDADDQKFLDLALGHGARWLLSRDRAVLKLARRCRPLGLEVVRPEVWAASVSR